jgi:DNA-binding MarR family transcriptional regulator
MVARHNYGLDPTVDFQDAMVQLIRALGLHRADATPCGQPVSVGEAHAMLEIGNVPGISQNGLARRLRVDKSTVSRIVAMLERRGWVQRSRDETDSRLHRLSLTASGVRANKNISKSRREKFESILSAIPRPRRADVLAALSTLTEAIRES